MAMMVRISILVSLNRAGHVHECLGFDGLEEKDCGMTRTSGDTHLSISLSLIYCACTCPIVSKETKLGLLCEIYLNF